MRENDIGTEAQCIESSGSKHDAMGVCPGKKTHAFYFARAVRKTHTQTLRATGYSHTSMIWASMIPRVVYSVAVILAINFLPTNRNFHYQEKKALCSLREDITIRGWSL